MNPRQQSELTTSDVYNLINGVRKEINENVKGVEDKVDEVSSQVANINGRLMMIPFLISTAISIFFFILNFFTHK